MRILAGWLLLWGGAGDGVDDALKEFRALWAEASRSGKEEEESLKVEALTRLFLHRDDRVLEVYIEKIEQEGSFAVREKCARGIGQYPSSKKAMDAVFEQIRKLGRSDRKKNKGLILALFEAGAGGDPALTRAYAKDPLDFFNDRENEFVISAVKCVEPMKHAESVKPLIRLLDKLQDPVRKRMKSWKPPEGTPPAEADCDGD